MPPSYLHVKRIIKTEKADASDVRSTINSYQGGSAVMFSQTIEYALRAMVQLAVDSSDVSATKDIAQKAKVPSAYLA